MHWPIDVDAVFWDWNGTLLDDTQDNFAITRKTVKQLGGTPFTLAGQREVLARTGSWLAFYRACGITDLPETIVKTFFEIRPAFQQTQTVTTNAYDTLEELWRRGIAFGLVSSYEQNVILRDLRNYGIAKYFDPFCVRANRGAMNLRKEQAFATLLNRMHILPARAVAVGDLGVEMRAARALGMHAIGYLGGLETSRVLKQAGAERCIRKLSTLTTLLCGRERDSQ